MPRSIIAVAAILFLLPLSGCLWVAAGAGAAGTYSVVSEVQKSREKQKKAEEKEAARAAQEKAEEERFMELSADERAAAIINTKFVGGGLTRIVNVSTVVRDGVATLYGNVPAQSVADRAVELAGKTEGIKQVIPRLVIIEAPIMMPENLRFAAPPGEAPPRATPQPIPPPQSPPQQQRRQLPPWALSPSAGASAGPAGQQPSRTGNRRRPALQPLR